MTTDIVKNALGKIEEALQIKLEKENSEKEQENTYRSYNNRRIHSLTFSNLNFDNFDALAPVYKMVSRLKFINCTINDVSALLNLEWVNDLTLDSVKLKYVYEPSNQPVDTPINHFRSVKIQNMEVEHISILLPLSKNLRYLTFTKCKIHNLYEINLFPNLSHLTFTEVIIHKSPKELHHKGEPNNRFFCLNFENMEIDNLDFFLPISENIESLGMENCVVRSLQGIHQFPKLEVLEIDAATTIETVELPTDSTMNSLLIKRCFITEISTNEEVGSDSKTFFDFQKLAAIAPNIRSFHFNKQKVCNTDFLQHFIQLDTLKFQKSEVDFDLFLSVAPQIKVMSLDTCTFKNHKSLRYFKQLENLEIHGGYDEGVEIKGLENLKRLLPLKHQLKKLRLWEDDVKELSHIESFTAIESLDLYEVSKKTAEHIFSLSTLKRLRIDIANKKECSFDLKGIKNIEWLIVQSDHKVTLKGLEHLDSLERLELEDNSCNVSNLHHLKNLKYFKCNNSTDINKIEKIETLQTLEFDVNDDYEINGLEQFPNLEYLSVPGTNKIVLGKLNHLKVLNMEGGAPDNINFLKELPNLEKLDLGYKGLTEIPDLKTLTNLKMLSLAENSHIKNIEGLKYLKRLEDLNLYDNKISDIRILNTLPNLKEVNLAANPIDKKEVEKQLDKPEIAVFYGLPLVPFRVWSNDYFEL